MKDLKEILYGNNTLISIAWTATSPTQAAKKAQLMGLEPKKVRAIKNAANILRDEGVEAFHKNFDPFEIVDTEINQYKNLKGKIKLSKPYNTRPLNATEYNEVCDHMKQELKKFGVAYEFTKRPENPMEDSAIDWS